MEKSRMCTIAGIFAGFQFLMPMAGWVFVHTVLSIFKVLEKCIPWVALILLAYIGGMMILTSLKRGEGEEPAAVSVSGLIIQGIATSIDALSVGLTIGAYDFYMALTCAVIIAAVTFFICIFGLALGKKLGSRLSQRAEVFGGCILILVGLEIFITGIL